jgi:transposase InsO family protein
MTTNSDAQRLRKLEKTLSPRSLRKLLPAILVWPSCSERRACRILGLYRSPARYRAGLLRSAPEVELALLAVFSRHPRLGHRKAKVLVNRLLAAQGLPSVGLRQIRRLRRLLCLSVPQEKPRRTRRGHTTGRIPTKAAYARHVWTWDFVSDITTRGGGFRTLVLIDEHTKQCVAHHVARRIGADDVMAVLSKAIEAYGAPEHIRSDNGPEFIARTVRDGLANLGIRTLTIDPGSPWQNGYVESFNSRFRDECLNSEQLYTLSGAYVTISDWICLYNVERTHGGVGYLTPNEAAARPRAFGPCA